MEIRRISPGGRITAPAAPRPAKGEKAPGRAPSADRLELSQWVSRMDESRAQAEREFYEASARPEACPEDVQTEAHMLDGLEKALDAMQKCAEIAARLMAGKKIPLQDEQYLMDNDPQGYRLALAMRREEEDEEECDSVLDPEDLRRTGQAEAAPSGPPPRSLSPAPSGPAE